MALIPTPRLTSSPGFASVTARFPLGRPVWACGFFPVRASPPTSPPTPPFYCWVYCFKSAPQICLLFPRIKKCPTCRLLSLCLASQRRQSPAQIHQHKFYCRLISKVSKMFSQESSPWSPTVRANRCGRLSIRAGWLRSTSSTLSRSTTTTTFTWTMTCK